MPRKKAISKTPPRKQTRKKPVKKVVSTLARKKSKNILFLLISVVCLAIALLIYFNSNKEVPKNDSVLAQVTAVNMYVPESVVSPQSLQEFSAKGVYAFDVESGKVLFEKNADNPVLPASTTKLATALVAIKGYNKDQVLTVGRVWIGGSRMGLVQGEQISVESLLQGLLILSANDAAEVLAQNYPGGRAVFIDEMNNTSKEIGLTQTHFTNPAGFDEYLHYSTPKDLVKIAMKAYDDPLITSIVGTKNVEVSSTDGRFRHRLYNTNQLLGTVDGVIGIKTGTTTTSGESLVTLIRRDKHDVMIALMGSHDRFGETRALIDWIYTNYEWREKEIPVEEME